MYLVPFGSNHLIFMGLGAGLHVGGDFLEKKKKKRKNPGPILPEKNSQDQGKWYYMYKLCKKKSK